MVMVMIMPVPRVMAMARGGGRSSPFEPTTRLVVIESVGAVRVTNQVPNQN